MTKYPLLIFTTSFFLKIKTSLDVRLLTKIVMEPIDKISNFIDNYVLTCYLMTNLCPLLIPSIDFLIMRFFIVKLYFSYNSQPFQHMEWAIMRS